MKQAVSSFLFYCLFSFLLGTLPIHGVAQEGSISAYIFLENNPVEAVTILIDSLQLGAVSDEQGFFRIKFVPAGTHHLRFQYIGKEIHKLETTLGKGETQRLDTIRLEAGVVLDEVLLQTEMQQGAETSARLMIMRVPSITTILSEEGIARLPDRNAAEALRRVVGVVMESDQGEGRYVSFRGTPLDWSAALINGDRMPVANEEIEGRALNLDVLPTSLIEYIIFNQTLTPDIEGDVIGGSANFKTKTIPNHQRIEVAGGIGLNQKAQKPLANGSFLYGNRFFNGKLGVLVGASIYARNWATDNYEVYYGNNDDHNIERLELRKYNGTRTTFGSHFKMDFRPNENHEWYALGFLGRMNDEERNRKTMYNWVAGVGQSIKLQNIYNILQNQLWGAEFGGKHQFGNRIAIDYKLASYSANFRFGPAPFEEEDTRNGYYVIEFEKAVRYTDYLYLDEEGNITDELNSFSRQKLLDIDSPIEGYGDPYDDIQPTYNNIVAVKPEDTLFTFTKAFTQLNLHREQDPIVASFNLKFDLDENLFFKLGGKYRFKNGERSIGLEAWQRNPFDPGVIVYDEFNPVPFPQSEVYLQEIGNPYQGKLFPFFESEAVSNFIPGLGDRLIYLPFGENTPFYKQFIGSSYNYDEQVLAAYFLFDKKIGSKLEFHAGLRLEKTNVRVAADSVIEDIQSNTRFLSQKEINRSYLAVLPMLNVKYALNRNNNFRFAQTRSFRRPNFNELKPGEPEIHYADFLIINGNPSLRPTYSWNSDLSYQHLFGAKGIFTVGLFYKYVVDHIFVTFESRDADNNGVSNQFAIPGGLLAKTYENAEFAHAAGFELAFIRKLDFLPGFLQKLELSANYAYTYSRMKISAREELQPLPRQAKHVINARLSYDDTRFHANLGLNYRDPILMELNLFAVTDPFTGEEEVIQQNTDYDIFLGKNLTLDGSLSYQISERLLVQTEWNNLLNTPFVFYRGRRDRPVQTEFYGIRALVGLIYTIE